MAKQKSVELKMPTDQDQEATVETGLAEALVAQAPTAEPTPESPLINIAEPERPKTFLEQVHDRIKSNRLVSEQEAPRPPPMMSDRQREVRDAELEAGRKAGEKARVQQANRPQGPVQTKEGVMTPVARPGDHVPGLFSKDPAK